MADVENRDVYINGYFGCKTFDPPDQSIPNAAIKLDANDPVDYDKVQIAVVKDSRQADGSDVVSKTEQIHIARKSGRVLAVEVQCLNAPSGGNKLFTVDVKKFDEAAPTPATILYEVITVDQTIADGEVVVGTVTDDSYSDGDGFEVVVAASGSTGSQAQGICVTVWFAENPL